MKLLFGGLAFGAFLMLSNLSFSQELGTKYPSSIESITEGGLGDARQRMINEEGEKDGNNIAKLLRSAAGQNRRDLIDQIGQYNRARGLINY